MIRWLHLVPVALLLTLSVGCGSIRFTDNLPFNGVGSAVWLELEVNSHENDDRLYHFFVISPAAGLCDAFKRSLPDIAELTDDWNDADDADEVCEYTRDYWELLEQDFSAFSRENSGLIDIDFREDSDWYEEPRDGDVEGDCEDDDDCFDYHVQLFEDDPLALASSSVDTSGDDGCFDEDFYDDIDDAVEWYYDDGGDITVSHQGANQIRLDFDVDLDDEESDNSGDAEGWFSMSRCFVEVDVEYNMTIPFGLLN